jgi:hypothetical protein
MVLGEIIDARTLITDNIILPVDGSAINSLSVVSFHPFQEKRDVFRIVS